MDIDSVAMTPPEDGRVGPHPFIGRADRWCELPGCGRPDRNPIHAYPDGLSLNDLKASQFYALLEAAKAVARGYTIGTISAIASGKGQTALALLDQSLTALGHPVRQPKLSERAMAEVDRLRREDPEAYRRLGARIASDIVTKPEHRLPSLMQMLPEPERTDDGTSEVLADYQHRGQ